MPASISSKGGLFLSQETIATFSLFERLVLLFEHTQIIWTKKF